MSIARLVVLVTFLSLAQGENAGAEVLAQGSEVLDLDPALAHLVEESQGTLHAVFRKGGAHPTYLAGRMSTGTGLAELTSAAFLNEHAAALGIRDVGDLALAHVMDLGQGNVVRYLQVVGGVVVEYAGVAVRTDAAGRIIALSVDVLDVQGLDTTPAFGSEEAFVMASDALMATSLAHPDRGLASLVVLPMAGGEARLAWKLRMGAVPALLSNPVVYVDARTGETLMIRNAIWYDRLARVYPQNPVATPDLVTVTLSNLPAGSTHLSGDRTVARNCIDLHATIPVNFMGIPLNVHTCSEVQKAEADASGDFLFDPDPTAPEDDFAEAQMYHGVELAYEHYRALGFDLLDQVPIASTVNFRMPIDVYGVVDLTTIMAATDPNGPLYAFDNAMFMEAGNLFDIIERPEDSMIFGQGTEGDFAFDGDVITHEFGHAVVAATCGLGMYSLDEQGLDASTGALNEAFADTGAFCSTDDPVVGDYAGSWLTGAGIRDVDVDNACPADLTGESHEDSLMYTGAEWDVLAALPGDEAAVKQAFYNAEVSLTPQSDFEEASIALVEEIRTLLGDTAATTAQAALDAHGLSGCERVVELDSSGGSHPKLVHLPAQAMVLVGPFIPGPLQFRYRPGRGFSQLTLFFATFADPTSVLFGGTAEPVVLFKRGAAPISFEYSGGLVTGDWDQMKDAVAGGSSTWTATFWIDGEGIPEDDYHLMIATSGQSGFIAGGIRVTTTDDPYPTDDPVEIADEAPDEIPEVDADEEVEPTPDADTDPGDHGASGSGCGCTLVA